MKLRSNYWRRFSASNLQSYHFGPSSWQLLHSPPERLYPPIWILPFPPVFAALFSSYLPWTGRAITASIDSIQRLLSRYTSSTLSNDSISPAQSLRLMVIWLSLSFTTYTVDKTPPPLNNDYSNPAPYTYSHRQPLIPSRHLLVQSRFFSSSNSTS